MKDRISATLDPKTIEAIEKLSRNGRYRNKSHVIEAAVDFLSKEEKKRSENP